MSVTSWLFLLLLLERSVKYSPSCPASGVGNCPEQQSVCLSVLPLGSAAPHLQLRSGSLAILVMLLVIRWFVAEVKSL